MPGRSAFSASLLILIGLFCSEIRAQERERDRWQEPGRILDLAGIKPGMTIGEPGAGEGYFTFKIAERVGPDGAVYANDIDEDKLDEIRDRCAEEGIRHIVPVLGTENDPLFPDSTLDAVIMVYVFHHLDDPEKFLYHLARDLKPGASVTVVERDPDKYGGQASHFMHSEEVIEEMEQAGYQIDTVYTDFERDNVFLCRPEIEAIKKEIERDKGKG